ncbi:hypothetical protein [Streptomyces camelliae]|uniref:Uncharacterized protein n=1 Tax=Streptomyces camelliae TaxID=3004093 RepID=A0ABY7PCA6_9ACTN|nr:hypothetical protein [Streptomyces sp. HUAS 2-6]WBO67830.1 hypothetical protein O1G22_35935 [Streptomyces sp. HUAS 2-6]
MEPGIGGRNGVGGGADADHDRVGLDERAAHEPHPGRLPTAPIDDLADLCRQPRIDGVLALQVGGCLADVQHRARGHGA